MSFFIIGTSGGTNDEHVGRNFQKLFFYHSQNTFLFRNVAYLLLKIIPDESELLATGKYNYFGEGDYFHDYQQVLGINVQSIIQEHYDYETQQLFRGTRYFQAILEISTAVVTHVTIESSTFWFLPESAQG